MFLLERLVGALANFSPGVGPGRATLALCTTRVQRCEVTRKGEVRWQQTDGTAVALSEDFEVRLDQADESLWFPVTLPPVRVDVNDVGCRNPGTIEFLSLRPGHEWRQ